MPAQVLNKVKKARLKALARGGDILAEAAFDHDVFRTSNVLVASAPVAKGTTDIAAAVAANAASNAFTVANPTVARNCRVVFAASWDGGNVVVNGTDQFGTAVSETFTSAPGTTVVGLKVFKTVTSAAKTAVGATANTASIGTGDLLGSPVKVGLNQAASALLAVSGVFEAVTYDPVLNAFTPASVPNAARTYVLLMNV